MGVRVVKRPLIVVGCLLLIIAGYVGVSMAVAAHQQRERDQQFDAWVARSEAITDATLPELLRSFGAVALPSDLQRSGGQAVRVPGKFVAAFGPWHALRPPQAAAAELAGALRAGGFTNVTAIGDGDGWKVTGATSAGEVTIYVHPSGQGSTLSGLLAPEIPPCC
jgi:hypothetical protein